ncbi:class I SAM-dependent methyltransferase [Pseudonocardia sp. NPDC049635]|uniref:class I SAM-dependent methyltransferase n=1 Tax=Pseudonocardia sp. NPDC049635 TaxID=3155506 RepID=UPI0033E171E4
MSAQAYHLAGEFYELVARRQAASSGPPLQAALAGTDPAAGPVLEIGAGTGAVTEVIARTLPDTGIVATEPAHTMRAVLTARVAADERLRERVLVTDEDAAALTVRLETAPPGAGFCAAVLFGVVGHLDRPDRIRLWRALQRVLPVGAPVAVELMGVARPRHIPPVRLLREQIGDQVYEWWSAGEPAGPAAMRFDTTWRVLAGTRVVREVAESYLWHTLSVSDLVAETGWSGEPRSGPDGTEIAVLHPVPSS